MKKYIYTLLALLSLTGCSGFLDTIPGDSASDKNFWKTEKDAKLGLVGCYAQFITGYTVVYWDCASDNAYNFHRHEGYQVLGNSTLSASEPGAGFFSFTGIGVCNDYIKNESRVNFTTAGLQEQYLAEVKALRAYFYFIRAFNYGDYPLFEENFENYKDAQVPRTKQSEVYEFIERELLEVIDVLNDKNESGRFNKGAAQALLMRYYLYTHQYEKSLKVAQAIKGYEMPSTSFEESFLLDNQHNSEMILTRDYVLNTHSFDFTAFMPNSLGGWSSVVPTQSLVESFEMADGRTIEEAMATGDYNPENPYVNRDPRLRASIIYPGQVYEGKVYNSVDKDNPDYYAKANNASKTGYNFKKFNSNLAQFKGQHWNTNKSFPIFRYAEVLLTIAEAKVELGMIDDEVYLSINKVRSRAGLPNVDEAKYASQDKLRELIRRERRVEFAMEGLRRYDIIRWGIGEETMKGQLFSCPMGVVNYDDVVNSETGDVSVSLNKAPILIEERAFKNGINELLPIPLTQLDRNKKLIQNTGY